MASAENLDYFLDSIQTQDTHKRMQLHDELITYLHSSSKPNLLSCDDFERFLDGISAWICASNYKISLNGLEVLSCIVDKMENNFQAHLPTFVPLLVDRLADNKEQVRNSAQTLLLKITTTSPAPSSVFERLLYTYSHKSPRVREEVLILTQNTLKQLDTARNVGVSKLVPHVVKLLEDPSIPIREVALETLAVMYNYVGERLRQDVLKRDINPVKLNSLMTKFQEVDDVRRSSSSLQTPNAASSGSIKRLEDDRSIGSTSSLADSVASSTNTNNNKKNTNNNKNNNFKRSNSSSGKVLPPTVRKFSTPNLGRKLSIGGGTASGAIGVDEESFTKQFVQAAKINIYSGREFVERVTKVKEVLVDASVDWNKRIDALKEIRAWFSMTSFDLRANQDLFLPNLVTFEPLLQSALKDLRSQVVREACITVAFLAQEFHKDFFHFSEQILPFLIPLLPNSAKVMASSAYVTIKFLIQHVHNHKLIPIIISCFSSKNSVIRRQCMELLNQVLQTWSASSTEKQLTLLLEAIKKGVGDADAEARMHSRRAFWSLSDNFKGQADSLLHSLDSSKQRQLIGEQQGSSSSSLADLNDLKTPPTNSGKAGQSLIKPPRKLSGSVANKDRVTASASSYRRKPAKDKLDGNHASSDLDLTSLTNQMSRVGIGANNNTNRSQQALYGTLPRSRKTQVKKPASNLPTPTSSGYGSSINSSLIDRGRSKNKVGVSQSQPSSRSNSPAPRLSYLTPIQQPDVVPSFGSYQRTRRKSSTALNKSRESSRDPSPNRGYGSSGRRAGSIVKSRSRHMMRSTMGEDFMTSRLKSSASTCDSDDVHSETSSVCSDNSAYWNCGRQVTEDPGEMIGLLASGSWSERRDGLFALQNMLNNNRLLSRTELKKVTDIFSRMFHDPHGKVFSVFMETLTLLVHSHHTDMTAWLYILLTRLLAKTGADLLGSTQTKLQRALETVRSSFPTDQQFLLLSKFLIDQTQSPNLKVKASMLLYIHGLTQLMTPEDFVNTSDVRLALSRIITWTTEPKSVDVRKAAQAALLSLHALNPNQFNTIVAVLPKTFQEGAERILQTRQQQHSAHSSQSSSLKDSSSPVSSSSGAHLAYNYRASPRNQQPATPATGAAATSDDIYNSIRQTSEDIHNLVQRQQPHLSEFRPSNLPRCSDFGRGADAGRGSEIPIRSLSLSSGRILPTTLAVESRIPSFLQNLPDADIMARMAAGRGKKCNGAMQTWFGVSNIIKSEREEAEKSATMLSVPAILQELSHHNERNEERRTCLMQLLKKAREEVPSTWDEYFNTVLLILLETFTDTDSSIRALSLRVLSEFLRCHAERFQEYVELTVVRSLEAHKDPVKEVTRAAEECSSLLSRIIQPEKCHVILGPLIESDDFPINLASVKMMHQMVEESPRNVVVRLLPSIAPTLLKAYENNQSSVRKSSVVCLVAVYMVVGEELRPYLSDLHGSKIKLLNVYIKRAVEQQGGSSCTTSKTSSPTSVVEAQ